MVIPAGTPPCALLRPVATAPDRLAPADIRMLTQWRNRYVHAFLTEFEATEQRTTWWLINVVGPDPGKILFMVDDLHGQTFGYMGLGFIDWDAGTGEADAIVRGAPAPRGTMSIALRALLDWARTQLGCTRLGVRVRSDNSALRFYRKLGFRETHRVPLRRVEDADGSRFVEDPDERNPTVWLVHHEWPNASLPTRNSPK